jgi:hypothetical protein
MELKLSKSIPVKGEELTVTLPEKTVFKLFDPDRKPVPIEIIPGQTFAFTPQKSGVYQIVQNGREFAVPVVAEPLHIVYWHCPRSVRYVTARLIPRAERTTDLQYWNGRGVLPLTWIPGVGDEWKDWTSQQFIEEWGKEEVSGLMMDELSWAPRHEKVMGEITEALKIFHERNPRPYLAVYMVYAPGHTKDDLIKANAPYTDILMLECYLHGFQGYPKLALTWDAVKRCKMKEKCIIALGITTLQTQYKWITTKKEIRKQIIACKLAAPDAPGIAFFGKAQHDSVAEAGDQAIYEYFIMPVLMVEDNCLYNYGGMDARDIKIERNGKTETVELLAAGQNIPLKNSDRILPSTGYTVLPADPIKPPSPPFVPQGKVMELLSSQSKLELAETEGTVSSGLIRLSAPVTGKGKLSFEIDCRTINPYAAITIAFGNDSKNMNSFKFQRSDWEIMTKYGTQAHGMRAFFSNVARDGLPRNEFLNCSFQQGHYRFDLYCGAGPEIFLEILRLTPEGNYEQVFVETLETDGEFKFDRITFALNTKKDSQNQLELKKDVVYADNLLAKSCHLVMNFSKFTWQPLQCD